MGEYYIITTRHKALWPGGVLLFWGPNKCGYSTTLDHAGKYSKEDGEAICGSGNHQTEFMVPCKQVEAEAKQIVDLDKMKELTGRSSWEFA